MYKNMARGAVTLAFRCRVVEGEGHPTAEAEEVAWMAADEAAAVMPEARAVRVADALRSDGPFVRVHDGERLL